MSDREARKIAWGALIALAALIITILGAVAAAGKSAGDMSRAVLTLSQQVGELQAFRYQAADTTRELSITVGRLEERLNSQTAAISDLTAAVRAMDRRTIQLRAAVNRQNGEDE